MTNTRFQALNKVSENHIADIEAPGKKISDFYAMNVFTEEVMKIYLSKDAFDNVMLAIKSGSKIDRATAEQVASAMKAWAISRGVTHYTHWFQPLTGATAVKNFHSLSS